MAEKGARAELEPLAMQMYAAGKSLTDIADALGVSRQTLSDWKARAGDEWDKARERKGDNHQRMQLLFERQITFIEDQPPHLVTAPMVDALSKIGALVEKTEKIATAARKQALEEAANTIKEAVSKAPIGDNFKFDPRTIDYITTVLYGLTPK